jgi:hypothetical protein
MKFLVVELGDVCDGPFDARREPLLLCIVEGVDLQDRHIDTAEMLQVGEVGERSRAHDRNDTPRCPIIDDTREVLGHPHGDTGRTGRLELDNSPVDIVRVRSRYRRARDDRGRRHQDRQKQENGNGSNCGDRSHHRRLLSLFGF